MNLDRLGDTLRSALDLNARYYAALLDLSTGYLKSLGALVAAGAETPEEGESVPPPQTRPAAPLLLAARAGEEAAAAFVVENTLAQPVTASVVARGTGSATRAVAVPETMTLQPGEETVVRVSVPIDADVEVGRDHHGEFAIPEMSARSVPFVVRRLPDADPAAGPKAESTRRRSAASDERGRTANAKPGRP